MSWVPGRGVWGNDGRRGRGCRTFEVEGILRAGFSRVYATARRRRRRVEGAACGMLVRRCDGATLFEGGVGAVGALLR